MIQWIIIREDWPKLSGRPIAYMKCRYDTKNGVWYNEQSGGTYTAEEFASFEKCQEPEAKAT